MAGWEFNSDAAPRERLVVGRLWNAHISTSGRTPDDDTCFDIRPSPEFQHLLMNRGHYVLTPQTVNWVPPKPNENGNLECEIHVAEGEQRQRHLEWVDSLTGEMVTAHGVWVQDTGHDYKTELHPVDVVFGPASASIESGDWIGDLATQRGLVVGVTMLAFRFAAASDNRGNFWNWAKPLLSQETRPTTFTVPFPPPPDPNVFAIPRSELRTFLRKNAFIEKSDPVDLNGTMVQPVTVTCLDRDHGGPGTLLGELVTYWAAPVAQPTLGLPWLFALYIDLLGRAPGANELAGWMGALEAGQSPESVANGFLRSQEYCTRIITGLYEQLLDRAPDPAGLAGWVSTMEGGAALQQIVLGFCDSPEYQSDNPPPAQFVESLYERLLGRASDPAGKQGWIDALAAGLGTAHIINGFLTSGEYCSKSVTGLYQSLLGRQPDVAEMAGWVDSMSGGTPFQDIQRGFLTSIEYETRALTRLP